MHHKEQFARDVAERIRERFGDDLLYSWSDDAVIAAVLAVPPSRITSEKAVAAAIMKANVFTDWQRPGTDTYREILSKVRDAAGEVIPDYRNFLDRQLELRPIIDCPKSKPLPRKGVPVTPEQQRAFDNYLIAVRQAWALQSRQFPDNVVDMLAYRARCEAFRS